MADKGLICNTHHIYPQPYLEYFADIHISQYLHCTVPIPLALWADLVLQALSHNWSHIYLEDSTHLLLLLYLT